MPGRALTAQAAAVDHPAALSLVRRARELRELPLTHGTVTSYKAAAEGHIYFFLDRDDGRASIPMRVDQVAVDLYQNALGRRRQIIRGLRKRELLPIEDFRYYIDRLTAVQNGFGDRIAIGEGRDVRDVPHPLGSDGETTYRYRVVDSVRVTVGARPAPVRVYELEVRPRREDRPGFVGSVFLEAETGALVRMIFSFTPASYVDPRTDRVTVRLEHSLWEEGLSLPYRQVVEVRREVPELDLPVGTVIRATLEVSDYEFNPELQPGFFYGPALLVSSYGAADSSVFRDGLMDRMAEEGLSPASLAQVEAEARRAARAQLVSGLPRVRVYADGVSSVLRANRAEGVYVGLGGSYAPRESVKVDVLPGYGVGGRALAGRMRGRWIAGEAATATVELYRRQLRDAGPLPAASGAVNTLSTLFRDLDYTDPWFATGVALELDRTVGESAGIRVGAFWEEMSGARSIDAFGAAAARRPLRSADEGAFAGVRGGIVRRWGGLGGWEGELALDGTVGRWDGGGNAVLLGRIEAGRVPSDLSGHTSLSLEAGTVWGSVPLQHHFLLGGRGTLPGHDFRAFGGRRFVLARGETTRALAPGWLSVRLLAGAGAVGATPGSLAAAWEVGGTGGVRGYAGAGLATLHDIVRIDGVWGMPDGAFELVLSVSPVLRPYL